jgi:3-oxoacyl-[acyl-carrier protein] reductase
VQPGDAAAVDALVPSAVDALGKLDILVNNAGVTRDNLAMRMKDEEWDHGDPRQPRGCVSA